MDENREQTSEHPYDEGIGGVDAPKPPDLTPPPIPEPEGLPEPPEGPGLEPPPAPLPPSGSPQYLPPPPEPYRPAEKSRVVAGVLGILLGWAGAHKFYLGYTKEGLIMLAVTVLTFGIASELVWILGVVEGILYLAKSDAEFQATYVVGRRPWL